MAVDLDNVKHKGVRLYADVSDLVVENPIEVVAGGAGFTNQSGAVSLYLTSSRAFHHTMVGNITSLAFSNVPSTTAFSASWTWVVRKDGTANVYSISGAAAVTFVDGRSFSDADLTTPNAENIFTFWQVGSITYGALVTTGELAFDPYKVCFLDNATVVVMAEAESIDVANDSQSGDGTITYAKTTGAGSPTTITTRTTFAVGDRLSIICTGATGTTTVRIPRYAL